jgi:hypothetical protein
LGAGIVEVVPPDARLAWREGYGVVMAVDESTTMYLRVCVGDVYVAPLGVDILNPGHDAEDGWIKLDSLEQLTRYRFVPVD